MIRSTVPAVLCLLGITVVAACGHSPPTALAPTPEVLPPCERPGCEVRPLDPLSLTEMPGYAALKLGGWNRFALSPDSRKLALFNWQRNSLGTGTLHIVDIRSWTEQPMNVSVEGYVPQILYGSDGKTMYWPRATKVLGIRNGPGNFVLYRYDLEHHALGAVATFPPTFDPREMRLLRSGDRLAVYGILVKVAGPDEPHVLVIDLAKNEVAADVAIAGLTDGQASVPSGSPTPYQEYGAGRAWDQRNDRLYLVHATGDRVTSVDLRNGTLLAQTPIRRPQSMADRLLRWLIVPAEAKLESGERRAAAVSPNGTRLYMTGMRWEVTHDRYREIPLGLQIIDTRDFTELRRLELPSGDLALSPTGDRLLLTGSRSGLYVVDAKRLEPSANIGQGFTFNFDSFSLNGRYAYVRRSEAPRSGEIAGRLFVQSIDLETQHLGGERQLDGYPPSGLLSVIAAPRS